MRILSLLGSICTRSASSSYLWGKRQRDGKASNIDYLSDICCLCTGVLFIGFTGSR